MKDMNLGGLKGIGILMVVGGIVMVFTFGWFFGAISSINAKDAMKYKHCLKIQQKQFPKLTYKHTVKKCKEFNKL